MEDLTNECDDVVALRRTLLKAVTVLEEIKAGDPGPAYYKAVKTLEEVRQELGVREGWY